MTVYRTFFAAVTGLLLGLSLALSPAAASEQDPKAFVTNLASSAMETMTTKGLSDQERSAKFRTLFTSDVDVNEIAKFVLGYHWRPPTTAEQQQEFLRLFEDIVVMTWSTRFKDYGGDLRHTVTDVNQDGERGITVDSKVDREKQNPIALQWRLKRSENGLRVVDLIVEGASMRITYRSEYASVIQANGGKIEGLLVAMRNMRTKLQANDVASKTN
ncbi:MAG: ABC transporter substrate-binding protein [Phaeospirillum sp.]|nr:ABC transporter substrate-binding protein [Phaeospirillum sp.]